MSLFVPWLVFPIVLALVSLGCGLLLESVVAIRLAGALVLPAGFAVVLVVCEFATLTSATAPFAIPLVVAFTVAGLALSLPWRRSLDGYAFAAAAATFLVFGAPVLLSGEATFTGYIKLDDTATWLALADRVMEHGRSLDGLAPSSYWAVLDDTLPTGYPVGAFLPLGVARTLVAQDAAWVFQPYLAFAGAMLALALYVLATPLVRSRALRAVLAFVASQPALLYAYTLWGGIKEIVSAALLALTAALVAPLVRTGPSTRATLPIAISSAAVLSALSVGGAVWLAPMLLSAAILIVVARGRAHIVQRSVLYLAWTFLLTIPAVATASVFLGRSSSKSALTSSKELGNLFHPLSKLEFFGIWPSGDFRVSPGRMGVTDILILAVVIAAGIAAVAAWRRAARQLLVYAAGMLIGCALLVAFGSPWIGGKALATASPLAVLLGMSGGAVAFEAGRKVEGLALAGVIAGGVVWSNVLGYHDVTLAPRPPLAELARIDARFKGQGPTLLNEYSPYGVRHFLRDMAPESPSERRVRPVPLRNGLVLQKTESADLDAFELSAILVYRTLIIRRSPAASRPPSVYRRVWGGRYYDVWQRPEPAPSTILEHLSLGTRYEPAVRPRCSEVMRLAQLAGVGGRLAAVERPPNIVVELSAGPYAAYLQRSGEDRRVVYLRRRSTLSYNPTVPASGQYEVWLGGSFLSELHLAVDGTTIATRRHELNWPGQFTPMGDVHLGAGPHSVTLTYAGPDAHPGSGGEPPFGAGPIVLSRATDDLPVTHVEPAVARSLCGKRLDWVEALRG